MLQQNVFPEIFTDVNNKPLVAGQQYTLYGESTPYTVRFEDEIVCFDKKFVSKYSTDGEESTTSNMYHKDEYFNYDEVDYLNRPVPVTTK